MSKSLQSDFHWTELASLLLAAFSVALGFGVVLPVLPTMVERLLASPDPASVGWHTAMLTSAFVLTPLVAAPAWGYLSDRHGRRLSLALGLIGFAASLIIFVTADDLPTLYTARLINGGFAAAVLPAALAFMADVENDPERRARKFGIVNVVFTLGLLAGPMLGSFAKGVGNSFAGGMLPFRESLPFSVVIFLSVISALAVWLVIPSGSRARRTSRNSPPASSSELSLLFLSAMAAGGLGAFEVGLTLHSRDLTIAPESLGFIFGSCMAVMLVVQLLVFSPLMKPASTRWLVAPSFLAMAAGLILIPLGRSTDDLIGATGLVAAGGGLLTPVLAYWLSRTSHRGQGAELGFQTAAASLGQAMGALGGGLLIGSGEISAVVLILPFAMTVAGVWALRLSSRLVDAQPVQL